MKLLQKIILGYIIFGILAFITVAVFTSHQNETYLREHTAASLKKEAGLIASDYGSGNYTSQFQLNNLQERLTSISDYLEGDIYVIDQQGEIITSSIERSGIKAPQQINGFDILDFSDGYYTITDLYGRYSEPVLCIYTPVTKNYLVNSYILICKPVSQISGIQSELLNIDYLTLLIVYAISFLVLVLYILFIHCPLKKLKEAAMHYNNGDYAYPLSISGSGELGYIAASFNYMTHELGTLEEDQRKFVSNISHDFRSPLTSIKGYAQAISDGTIPPEFQKKYLDVIIFETERLEKLTQNLLELNKYGSNGFLLDITVFDLNRCIKMAVQTFEQISREKQIYFNLILTGSELYTEADESKIHQVLQNLIDNAIKFSRPDSSIEIETTVKKDKIFVSVKDHGIGIPKDSIGKIWERFYKTDVSRGKDKKGTGLGLSIVKEIINAHHENINVISTLDVGTEFIFTLPLVRKKS